MHHDKAGIENTESTLRTAFQYAAEKDVKDVVIASTAGYTAREALKFWDRSRCNLVIVTHNTGFGKEGEQTFPGELRDELTALGAKVHTGTMVLRSLGTAIRELQGYSQQDLVANTLRMFCQGIKVCVEIVAMAADGGLISFQDVIAVAGTGRGADTACLIDANSSNRFFKIKIREIIIKPKEF